MRSVRMSDFILIHSTGEAPACWQRLSTALELHGHHTHPVDLPVDRPELLAEDYANIMTDQVGHITDPIVLAHSGSGTLLPAASKALKARHRVWLAVWVPNPTRQLYRRGAGEPDRDVQPGLDRQRPD